MSERERQGIGKEEGRQRLQGKSGDFTVTKSESANNFIFNQ